MILKPKNKKQLVEQVKRLPPRKRRVVVLVGRHPNEGSINIGNRYNEEWAQHGAVVVRIPPQWTPHYFWKKEEKKKQPIESAIRKALLRARRIPEDTDLIQELKKNGVNSPVVNLHGHVGTPSALHIVIHKDAPRYIDAAVLRTIVGTSARANVREAYGRDIYGDESEHQLEVLVEHCFMGRRKASRRKIAREHIEVGRNLQVAIDYVNSNYVDKKALNAFHTKYSTTMTRLIKELAKRAK